MMDIFNGYYETSWTANLKDQGPKGPFGELFSYPLYDDPFSTYGNFHRMPL